MPSKSYFDAIQDAIVTKRNNYGDYSVCGDDLALAAAAAILVYLDANTETRNAIEAEAESHREFVTKECPSLFRAIHASAT